MPNHIALIAHQDGVREIAFSPDGEYLATRGGDGMVKIVQVSTGQEIATIAHKNEVREIEFSPDGEYLATGGGDGTAKIVQLSTGQEIATTIAQTSPW